MKHTHLFFKIAFIIISISCLLELQAQQSNQGRDYYQALQGNKQANSQDDEQGAERLYYDALQSEQGTLVYKDDPREVGRSYYESLIEKSLEHHWVAHFLMHYSLAESAFTKNNCNDNLAQIIFCKEFTVQDIFLLSKLSYNRLVHLDPRPYNTLTNMYEPIPLPAIRPPLSPLDFGNFASDQYVSLVANMKVATDAEKREFGIDLGACYRFDQSNTKLLYELGFNVPIRAMEHVLTIQLVNGTLFNEDFKPNPVPSTQESTMRQFFNDYASVEDFFIRGILKPKGITYEAVQRNAGVGDISIYGLVDCADYFEHVDGLQFGINFIFPTGSKQSGNVLWEIELGNGGAFQVDLFANGLFKSPSSIFNPMINIVAELSTAFTGKRRIPELKSVDETIQLVDTNVFAPYYESYYVEPFSEYDTTVPEFADNVIDANIKYGTKFLLSLGNYFYNVFSSHFRIGLMYQYMRKSEDTIEVCKQQLDTKLLEDCSEVYSHSVSWNLSYQFGTFVDLSFGSWHVFDGVNVPKTHEVFASLAIVF